MLSLINYTRIRICLHAQILLLFFILSQFQAESHTLKVIPIDIAISQELIGGCRQSIGNELTFKIKVFRQDKAIQMLDEIVIKDSLNTNFTFISATVSMGTYDSTNGLWRNIAISQSDTATLLLKVKIKNDFEGGIIHNEVWLQSMNCHFVDIDSEVNNRKKDDIYAISSASVPFMICSTKGERMILSAPTGYTTYNWFKDGVLIDNAKTEVLLVDSGGAYSIRVNIDSRCPYPFCCPIYVDDRCKCPPNICVPFVVIKSKSKQTRR